MSDTLKSTTPTVSYDDEAKALSHETVRRKKEEKPAFCCLRGKQDVE